MKDGTIFLKNMIVVLFLTTLWGSVYSQNFMPTDLPHIKISHEQNQVINPDCIDPHELYSLVLDSYGLQIPNPQPGSDPIVSVQITNGREWLIIDAMAISEYNNNVDQAWVITNDPDNFIWFDCDDSTDFYVTINIRIGKMYETIGTDHDGNIIDGHKIGEYKICCSESLRGKNRDNTTEERNLKNSLIETKYLLYDNIGNLVMESDEIIELENLNKCHLLSGLYFVVKQHEGQISLVEKLFWQQ